MAGSGEAVSAAPVLSITLEEHPANPRLRIVLRGQVKGDAVAEAFIRLYAVQPETVHHDRLFDFTGYQGGFEIEHLERIAEAYRRVNPDPQRPARTAFVTRDRHFGLWAASMSHMFRGRDLRAFGSFEEAERFLAEPIEQRMLPHE